jgi:cyclin T
MTIKEESDTRRRTCRYIEEACRLLKLHRVAIATAMVFFHRFYAKHAFSEHDRFEVAIAAIILAAKTEESPKKVDHVISVCHDLKNRGVQAGKLARSSRTQAEKEADEEFIKKLKERVLLLERVLLHTIGFELSIDHPYKFMLDQIRRLVQNKRIEFTPGSDKANEVAKLPTARIREALIDQMTQWYVKRRDAF